MITEKFLSLEGLNYLSQYLITSKNIQTKTKEDWEQYNDTVFEKGDILIISDYEIDEDGKNTPAIKIGDGIHTIDELNPIAGGREELGILKHSLTIGNKIFNGSQDVFIDVYDGDMNTEELIKLLYMQRSDEDNNNNNMLLIQNYNNAMDNNNDNNMQLLNFDNMYQIV